jgi:P27 family predicted phage terminase small subunit
LIEQGTFDRLDLPIIHLACAQWQRAAGARRVLAQDGMFAAGSQGQIVSHPAMRQERDATREFMRIMESLGAGPVGRARMGLAVLTGQRMLADLDAAIGSIDGEFIEGDAVPMTGAAVGLPGA